MSIINKAIIHITDEEKNDILKKELLLHPYTFHFGDIWYKYWEWFVLVAICIIIALIFYTTMTQRIAKYKIEQYANSSDCKGNEVNCALAVCAVRGANYHQSIGISECTEYKEEQRFLRAGRCFYLRECILRLSDL